MAALDREILAERVATVELHLRLSVAGDLDAPVASRLVKAAGFRDLIAHAYEKIDMARIHEAATNGPADLRAFLKRARDLIG